MKHHDHDDTNAPTVAIIGGGGHVGLPLGLVLADTGFNVTLIDEDRERLESIENGEMPFNEPEGQTYLTEALDSGRIRTSSEISTVESCEVLFVVIGTPVDEHFNPGIDNLLDLLKDMRPYLIENHHLIFRSTVYPGTTKHICNHIEEFGYEVGEDMFVSFAPERISQHNAFEELKNLPQLIGSFDDESYERTAAVFDSFLDGECLRLSPTEAELGKLFTNMWRYLTFAIANEFFLITETVARHHDVNIHRILEKTAHEYPRFDVPSPGPNVGGPCLTKDGWFLIDNIPYNELVSASYQINEGMPSQIIDRMAELHPDPDQVAILGMTFKANSDDIRNSVSFKLRKQLQIKGHRNVVEIEPNLEGFDDWNSLEGCDWVILMTPHEEFEDFAAISEAIDNDDCLYCDIWGFWDPLKYQSDNGYIFERGI
jgi:UDP-N-acetyl-D-mannosaminuronic acid dehydrogenase